MRNRHNRVAPDLKFCYPSHSEVGGNVTHFLSFRLMEKEEPHGKALQRSSGDAN